MRAIAVITGSRSEYGLLKPLLLEMERSDRIRLQLVVTGTHLLRQYGRTKDQILRDGFSPAAVVRMYRAGEGADSLGLAIGRGIAGLTTALRDLKSDLVVVLGDRPEAFAGAVAGMALGLPVAHLSGGEVTESGHIDEQVRHAISRIAHLHFPATKESGKRLVRMGEEPWRVHVTGDPGISAIRSMDLPSRTEVCRGLGFDEKKPVVLCIQHPVSHQAGDAGRQMEETLAAVAALGHQTVIVYPNGDPGSEAIIGAIKAAGSDPRCRIFRNLAREEYLAVLKNCDVMVGNSSSGIAEAPSFGVQVVNVGVREKNRENAGNVINVGHDRHAIARAIRRALSPRGKGDRVFPNPFEGKDPAREIVAILEHIDINQKLMVKKVME